MLLALNAIGKGARRRVVNQRPLCQASRFEPAKAPRSWYPSDDDPLRFEQQAVSSKEEGLLRVFPAGDEQIFPPRVTTDELFPEAGTGKSDDAYY